jgi:hypothetical protein
MHDRRAGARRRARTASKRTMPPNIPVWDRTERGDGAFSRSEFAFDAAANRYACPAGKFLKPTWRMKRRNPNVYRASQLDCQRGPLKSKCCPNTPHRRIERNPFELASEVARRLGKTRRRRQSRNDRNNVGERTATARFRANCGQMGWQAN